MPRQSGLVPQLAGKIIMAEGFRRPEAPGAGRLFPPMAALGLFQEPYLVPYGAAAPAGRQYPAGGLCHPVAFSAQPVRGFLLWKLGKSGWRVPRVRKSGWRGQICWMAPPSTISSLRALRCARPEARSGFAPAADAQLTVEDPQGLLEALPQTQQEALRGVLAQDPRPHYQKDPERVYGLRFDRWNVKFRVDGNTLWVEKLEE